MATIHGRDDDDAGKLSMDDIPSLGGDVMWADMCDDHQDTVATTMATMATMTTMNTNVVEEVSCTPFMLDTSGLLRTTQSTGCSVSRDEGIQGSWIRAKEDTRQRDSQGWTTVSRKDTHALRRKKTTKKHNSNSR